MPFQRRARQPLGRWSTDLSGVSQQRRLMRGGVIPAEFVAPATAIPLPISPAVFQYRGAQGCEQAFGEPENRAQEESKMIRFGRRAAECQSGAAGASPGPPSLAIASSARAGAGIQRENVSKRITNKIPDFFTCSVNMKASEKEDSQVDHKPTSRYHASLAAKPTAPVSLTEIVPLDAVCSAWV